MGKYNKKISDTKVRIGEVRFCFVNVFSPRKGDDGEDGKYSVCVVWPKTDKEATALVKEAIEAAKEKGKTSKWGGKIPASVANSTKPIRDGDIDREGDPAFEGMWFMNANSSDQPGIRYKENGVVVKAESGEDFYSGCWGAVTVNFYPYDSNGNKGVGAGLGNVIKTRDDERLSGGATAESDFADMEDDDDCLG